MHESIWTKVLTASSLFRCHKDNSHLVWFALLQHLPEKPPTRSLPFSGMHCHDCKGHIMITADLARQGMSFLRQGIISSAYASLVALLWVNQRPALYHLQCPRSSTTSAAFDVVWGEGTEITGSRDNLFCDSTSAKSWPKGGPFELVPSSSSVIPRMNAMVGWVVYQSIWFPQAVL